MGKVYFFGILCVCFSIGLAAQGADDASNYGSAWAGNGGSGFGDWILQSSGAAGHFLGRISENNASGANGDGSSGNIDTDGKAWGLFANNGALSEAFRNFDSSLPVGGLFSIDMDNGWVDESRTVGMALQNASGVNLFEFFFIGGSDFYTVKDNIGDTDSNIGFTADGVNVSVEITGENSNIFDYEVTITSGANNWTKTGTFMGAGAVERIRLFNASAGELANRNLYFNSLSYSSPSFPVQLTHFTAHSKGKQVDLHWQTATEQNNDHFELQRSADGRAWSAIGKIAGRGTTQQEQAYDYTDHGPLPGLSYYRLKQVDYDGAFEYHGPVSVRRGIGDGGMKAFPNPVGDRLYPVLPDADPQGQLRLVSSLGQEVGRWPAAAATDGLPVADLPAGVYLLQWLDVRGEARAEVKVVR